MNINLKLVGKKKVICAIFLFFILFFLARASAASVATFYFNLSIENDTTINYPSLIRSSAVLFQLVTDRAAECRFSTTKGLSFSSMEGSFDYSFETLHKKTLTSLNEGMYKYYIKCKNLSGAESKELGAVFNIVLPVSASISISKDPPLSAGRYEIEVKTSKEVLDKPSLKYSFDGNNYEPIPLYGSGREWKGYLIISPSVGEKVGSFKFEARDLEDFVGTEIKEGGVFVVDTIAPEAILNLKAESYEGLIKLEWFVEEEFTKFKIYRSTSQNVGRANFYKEVSSTSFSDSDVEKGKTYYYRVTAVDDAGNEGGLSIEVYATSLKSNSGSSSVLEPRLIGKVESVLESVDLVIKEVGNIKEKYSNEKDKESVLYNSMKLGRKLDSALSELQALRKEVNDYKSQSFSEEELNKKIGSAELKLNTIKKKIPQSIIIKEEKSYSKEYAEQDIAEAFLRIYPDSDEKTLEKSVKGSLEHMKNSNFKVNTKAYNLELVYFDGSRKEHSFIKEEISANLGDNENLTILEVVPNTIVKEVSELEILNINYEVIKQDTIISFSSATKEISYVINKNVDLNEIPKIKTFVFYRYQAEKNKKFPFSGYFSFFDFESSSGYAGVIFGILVVAVLGIYLFMIRQKNKFSENFLLAKKLLEDAHNSIDKGDLNSALFFYQGISKIYKNLGIKEKQNIFPIIDELRKKMEGLNGNI